MGIKLIWDVVSWKLYDLVEWDLRMVVFCGLKIVFLISIFFLCDLGGSCGLFEFFMNSLVLG